MKSGNLVKYAHYSNFLKADSNTWEWVVVGNNPEDGDYFLCLDTMDMTREWATAGVVATAAAGVRVVAERAAAAAAAATARRARWEEYNKIYNLALKEFEETGKILGYRFLAPDGKNTVWLSHYNVEFIEKRKKP